MKRVLRVLAAVAPEVKAHLHGNFDGGRAVVGEEAAIEASGRDAREFLGQSHRRLMGEAGEDHVLEFSSCSCKAELMRAFEWPNRFTHQELMPSR